MARPKEPINLVIAKNKSHISKEEIEKRKGTEVKAKSDNIKPPSFLTTKEKKMFKQLSTELIEIDIMSNLDCNALAFYVREYSNYVKVANEIDKIKDITNPEQLYVYKNLHKMQSDSNKTLNMLANALGLTISSRCKLVVPKPPEEEKKNKFAKFGRA